VVFISAHLTFVFDETGFPCREYAEKESCCPRTDKARNYHVSGVGIYVVPVSNTCSLMHYSCSSIYLKTILQIYRLDSVEWENVDDELKRM
jgi:hypothetical protein